MLRAFNSKQINVDRDIKDAATAAGDDEHELKVALRRQLHLQFM